MERAYAAAQVSAPLPAAEPSMPTTTDPVPESSVFEVPVGVGPRWHADHWAIRVTEAVVCHRPGHQTTKADMLWSTEHQRSRVRGLAYREHWTGIAVGEL